MPLSALSCAGAAALALTAFAQSEPAARQGLSEAGLAQLDAALAEWTETGRRAGAAALIARDGEILHRAGFGYADIERERPMTPDTPVLIASMTKPVTAFAVMQLVEDGAIALDQPLSDFVPEFAGTPVAVSAMADETGEIPTTPLDRPITIHDVLTHTAGLAYVFDTETDVGRLHIENSLYAHPGPLEAAVADLAALPLYAQPGERWIYSWSNDVLGRVVEVASGQPFDAYLQAEIFEPLGMDDTGFYLEDDADLSALATVYTHDEDGLVPVMVEGETVGDGAGRIAFPAGGAGLVSTAEDYARFALMLAGGGELDGVRLIDEDTLALMTRNQLEPHQIRPDSPGLGYGYGFGVALPVEDPEQAAGIPGDYFWGGYFDTTFLVSPSTGLVAVYVSQEQPSAHSGPNTRSAFPSLVYGVLPQTGAAE